MNVTLLQRETALQQRDRLGFSPPESSAYILGGGLVKLSNIAGVVPGIILLFRDHGWQ